MFELIIGIVLAVMNATFIVYVLKVLPNKFLSEEQINKVLNIAVDTVSVRALDFAEEHGLTEIDVPSLIENVRAGFTNDLIDGVVSKVKMGLLGSKGGYASGESKTRSRLLEAAGTDLMNMQPAWLRLVMKQFPSVAELIQDEPGLIAEIPHLLEEVKRRFNIDLTQYVGADGNQQGQMPAGFWW